MPLDDVQYKIRLPGQLHADLTLAAKHSGRSLSAEIIKRLEASLTGAPNIRWTPGGSPADLMKRHPKMSDAEVLRIAHQIADLAARVVHPGANDSSADDPGAVGKPDAAPRPAPVKKRMRR